MGRGVLGDPPPRSAVRLLSQEEAACVILVEEELAHYVAIYSGIRNSIKISQPGVQAPSGGERK